MQASMKEKYVLCVLYMFGALGEITLIIAGTAVLR